MSTSKKILIVEDELLIAKQIQLCIEDHGYDCVGIAIDYNGAVEIIQKTRVDLVLLDIKISGIKSGLDIANYLNSDLKIPFMFLTSFNDKSMIDKLKKLKPIGYINKPVNTITLTTNLDIYFNQQPEEDKPRFHTLVVGSKTININLSELSYVQADHVYIRLHYKHKQQLIRCSLSRFLELIPEQALIQINRSTAVNPDHILEVGRANIIVDDIEFKISKTYRASLLDFLSS